MTLTASVKALTTEATDETRVVQQIVSVFGNVDGMGDRVMPGAFAQTLADWEASPNTMSVYFSHQWSDPFANVGSVIGAEELLPGDERLPNDTFIEGNKTLRDLGGLLVTYQFDPPGQNALADQVFWLMENRRVTQASFAYDVIGSRVTPDGVNELYELALIEVGPTLLGVNRGTTTLADPAGETKSMDEAPGADGTGAEPEESRNHGEADRVRLEADVLQLQTTEEIQ